MPRGIPVRTWDVPRRSTPGRELRQEPHRGTCCPESSSLPRRQLLRSSGCMPHWPRNWADPSRQRNDLGSFLFWQLTAEGLSGASVEASLDGEEVVCGVDGQVGALGKVLAEQPVGVLVRPTLPWRVGVAEGATGGAEMTFREGISPRTQPDGRASSVSPRY